MTALLEFNIMMGVIIGILTIFATLLGIDHFNELKKKKAVKGI